MEETTGNFYIMAMTPINRVSWKQNSGNLYKGIYTSLSQGRNYIVEDGDNIFNAGAGVTAGKKEVISSCIVMQGKNYHIVFFSFSTFVHTYLRPALYIMYSYALKLFPS